MADEVALELANRFVQQAHTTALPISLAALLVVAMAWGSAPVWLVVAWSVADIGSVVLRGWRLRVLRRQVRSASLLIRSDVRLRLVRGFADASAVLMFFFLSDVERSVVTLIYAGLSVGAVGTSGGHRGLFLAYALPTFLCLSLGWALIPAPGVTHPMTWAMAPLILLFGLVLLGLATENHQALIKSVERRLIEAQLSERLRMALERAEIANVAKTRFLGSASHDLRQPLHSLLLNFETLALKIHDEEEKALLANMKAALAALGSQMDTLLDMSRLDAGMMKLKWTGFSLNATLHEVFKEFEPIAKASGVALSVSCEVQERLVSDVAQLTRILRNLLDNAIKYCKAGGTVELSARSEGDHVVVRVKDTGCGIPAELHEQVFEEFFQADNPERDRTRGLGLGLSIVRRLAELLRLKVSLVSEPGQGTTFSILMSKDVGTRHAPDEEESSDSVGTVPFECRVLVLDDEAGVRHATRMLLSALGCQVSVASCIEEALEQASLHVPDLVLADLRLRGREDGVEAILALRERYPGLPAVVVTGETEPDRLRKAHEAGVPVLHKPLDGRKLIDEITRSLEAGG